MSKHNNIYNILGKLSALDPQPQTPPQTSILKELPPKDAVVKNLNEKFQNYKQTLMESQQVNELSPKTLGNYIKKASADAKFHGYNAGATDWGGDEAHKHPSRKTWPGAKLDDKAHKRLQGVGKAVDKLAKEDAKPDYIDIDNDGDKDEPMKKAAKEVNEAYINNSRDAIKILANLRAIGKQGERGGQLPPGFANQVVNDLWDVITWIEANIGESVEEGEYQDSPNKSDIPAAQRKAKGGDDWKVSLKDLDDEASKSPTGAAGLAKAKARLGMGEGKDKPDYIDIDKDGDKDEPMKKAVKDMEKVEEGQTIQTKTGLIHKGTYGNSYQPTDDDEDDDAPKSTEPKKKGRPKKHTGPERVTSKAWKHKDGRKVAEAIKLDTYVEDTLAELRNMFVAEKAVSQQQQKFMGMVHAMQKGDTVKGASPELKKVAHDMGKKDAKDFASTKHKGLPKKVTESVLNEGMTLQAIAHRYAKEVRDFAQGGELDDNLYHALYDYYFDDMPYGVKKARDGDPYEWVAQAFDQAVSAGDIEVTESNMTMRTEAVPGPALAISRPQQEDHELGHLARLAGIGHKHSEGCNMSPQGQHCPVHGLEECWSGGSMMEGESKPDYIDIDKDGDKKEPMKKAVKDKEEKVDEAMTECGPDMMDAQRDGVNVSSNFDTRTGNKNLTVSAQGDAAEELAQLLKSAGLMGGNDHHDHGAHMEPEMEPEMEEAYANEPEEDYVDTDAIEWQGSDLNRPKSQYAGKPKLGDNPMSENFSLESKLQRMYDSLKIKSR